VRGPAVADVAAHFETRWQAVTGEALSRVQPTAALEGGIELQVVRTVPERIYPTVPEGDLRLLESYVRALRSGQKLIYLESQFLWSPEIARILADKLRQPPSDSFRLVLLLPARPNNGTEDMRATLAELVAADNGAGRFLACTLYARRGALADRIYVHAKIAIVDDRWITIGSADLNEHSLFNDTEMNVVAHETGLARETRLRLWAEHLERPRQQIADDPAEVVDSLWRPLAAEQLERRQRGHACTHRSRPAPTSVPQNRPAARPDQRPSSSTANHHLPGPSLVATGAIIAIAPSSPASGGRRSSDGRPASRYGPTAGAGRCVPSLGRRSRARR
jgi:phosphatidylserine/phosphatidylglycerophosphate/cardiolipin synthase-like enzyme